MKKPVIYQVLPRLWGNGRFSSFDARTFSYLDSLNVTHIWYTGIIRHSTGKDFVKGDPGSPYAISDYYDVNPYLSDEPANRMQEFEDLVRRTHEAGFKVIIDFVPNHVGCDYSDSHGGIRTFRFCDYDWDDTFKIDYGSGPCHNWDHLLDILKFWAGKGVDGFRCDMVELVPPAFFSWAIQCMKLAYPGTVFIAEVYDRGRYREYIEKVGFDWLYDKSGIYDTLFSIVRNGTTARAITWNWQSLGDLQPRMLNFLENHDELRFASDFFGKTPAHEGAPLGAALMLNTAPFMLYFGQEIGLDASESGNGRTSIFNWTRPEGLERLFRAVSEGDESVLNPGEQAALSMFRQALSTTSDPDFSEGGTFDLCYCNEDRMDTHRHFAFLRGRKLVFLNFSGQPFEGTLRIPQLAFDCLGLPESFPAEIYNETAPYSFTAGAVI